MCGPSSALKAINTQIQSFTNQVTAEASTVFSGASSVFNTIVGALTNIVQGGPGQQGFSAGELSARNAAAVNAGAAENRNLKAAALSSAAAIGGGNVATPSGATEAIALGAEEKAASDTAGALNEIQSENYATGRDNFFKAERGLQEAPGVFATANQSNEVAGAQQKTAFSSQQEMDNQSNWAMNDIMKLGSAAISGFTGGMGAGFMKGFGGGGSSGGGSWSSSADDIGAVEDAQLNQQN